MTKYLFVLIAVLSLSLIGIGYYGITVTKDRNRIATNFEQAGLENSELNLKYGKELSDLKGVNNKYAIKLDSVMKANKIKPKQVITATIVNTIYRDTGSVKIVYREPEILPNENYSIGVSYADSCWSMKGVILTTDKLAKLNITERSATNSIQLLVTRKRFLGFLWFKKEQTFRAYTDCGEVDFSQINFE